jgi:PAS domain S-box-containing protein
MRHIPTDFAETRQAVVVGRPDGTIVHMSDAFARLTGLTQDAVVGRGPAAAGLIDDERLRWLLERLPAPGHGFRYLRRAETPAGLQALEVDVHSVGVDGEALVVATIHAVAAAAAA